MDPFGFHVVAGGYCVEVLEEEFLGLGEASADGEGVDCASYLEAVCVGLLEGIVLRCLLPAGDEACAAGEDGGGQGEDRQVKSSVHL